VTDFGARGPEGSGGALRAEQYLAPETIGQLATFELRARMIAEGITSGMHRSPFQGPAVEFAEHRSYVPGDDLRHLDWKVFARTDKLHLKRFQQETTLDVEILVDGSGSMSYGSLEVKRGWGGTEASTDRRLWTKFDHAVATAAALAYLALQQRDRVGLSIYADGLGPSLRRRSSRDQWRSIVRVLASAGVEGVANLSRSIDQAIARQSGRGLMIVISDLLGPIEDLHQALATCRHRRPYVVLLQTLDRRELHFSIDGSAPFEGLEGEGVLEADARAIRQDYLNALRLHLEEVRRTARGFGFDHLLLDTHASVGPALALLLARRSAMLRSGRTG
jgi:uncharacterized protein (DUF58 family)